MAYNFLASWQLFPEKCVFEHGLAPKSGNYRMESIQDGMAISISSNWVTLEQEAYHTHYTIIPNGERQPFADEALAQEAQATMEDTSTLRICFFKDHQTILTVLHEIMPNGYLRITHRGQKSEGGSFTNIEIYHKQLSVLPYAASVGGVVIRPTREGAIKHKALTAMEEQTNMQLDQIREQIELLARQAQEISKRKELSRMVYEAKLNFKPQIGQTYHLYERKDGTHTLSMVAPKEWGGTGPFQQFLASVKLLADHTWVEVHE